MIITLIQNINYFLKLAMSKYENPQLLAQILKRCRAITEGGTEAAKYREGYYADKNIGYNRGNYSNIFNLNNSYKPNGSTFNKGGNVNIIQSGISTSSSMSRTGPNISGFK
jgi:hypothetical protein